MELEGAPALSADAETVWAALFDPGISERAIPCCECLKQTGDTSCAAVVKLKIGPVSDRFKGDVEFTDIDPLKASTLSGKGTDGIAGFAKGSACVTLEPHSGETQLAYVVEATVGGKLVALGSRLIKSTVNKLARDFFAAFEKILSEEAEAETAKLSAT
ncbi:carbon monoxide dehydrogenase subunit G [Labrenzia sp. DG1229]|uniref:CoxG family protein n=1 Tax=Labrenzia sp. DG1229 TaxID=681847 RepID=UPI0004916360|nr:carbon monoxide dehydrogenase subunit G [Labrenzia sp. DG1229]